MPDSYTAIADVVIKGLVLVGAGAFFGYKTVSGFNNQNLSLAITCERASAGPAVEGMDLVIPTITIEKGTTAALALEALEVRFKWGAADDAAKIVRIDIGRLVVSSSDGCDSPRLSWNERDPERPHLYLAPGEKTSFACAIEVPHNVTCRVDVVAVGRRRRSTFQAQWRGSAVVPPVHDKVQG